MFKQKLNDYQSHQNLPQEQKPRSCTFTFVLVWAILAVDLSIAAQRDVYTLLAVTLELFIWAHRAVTLITLVITLCKSITAPRLWYAVNLTRSTWELHRWTSGRLCGSKKGLITQGFLWLLNYKCFSNKHMMVHRFGIISKNIRILTWSLWGYQLFKNSQLINAMKCTFGQNAAY